jgi:hypothetical protein
MFKEFVIAALLIVAVPAMACNPKLELQMSVDHPPPTIRSTYNLDKISSLAASVGQPLHHEAFGFYISTFGYNIKIDDKVTKRTACEGPVAEIRLFLTNRVIELASDLESHGCRREPISAHYLLHARLDDEILGIYAGQVMAALRARFAGHSFEDPGRGNVHYIAGTAIRQVVDRVLQSFGHARDLAIATADNDQELKRLTSACNRSL